jgi:fucose 4-O-acetylase-like acetyltransferase
MNVYMNRERIQWIDWMKVIGMYFIIAGHLFPKGYTYIYIFNVPIFFIISGFLYKHEKNNILFLKKIFFNYICPVVIIRTIMYFWEKYTNNNSDAFFSLFEYWFYMFKGQQNCIGACWFIYTLILIKCLFQYITIKKILIAILLLLTGTAIVFNIYNIHKNNAILNVIVSIQPFAIGYYLRKYKEVLIKYHISKVSFFLLFAFSISIIFLCGKTNGNVWLYQNGYGKSIILYLIGIISGTIFLFILAKLFENKNYRFISILSTGNILTLGFHQFFVNVIQMNFNTDNFFSYALAFIILILFIPLIIICKAYFPFILGIYHPSSNKAYDTQKK